MLSTEIASRWGEKHGYNRFLELSKEDSGIVYYLFHSESTHGKNGLPQFIRVSKNGEISDSFQWSYEEIGKYISILRTLNMGE